MIHIEKDGEIMCALGRSLIGGSTTRGDEHGNVEVIALPERTQTALASDCNDCRGAVGVALVGDKTWAGTPIGVRPVPTWKPEPRADADELVADAIAHRFGC